VVNIAGAVVAKKVIQLIERVGNVLIAHAINHVQPLSSVGMEEPQMVRLSVLREKRRA
jgi:hypothetical protein